MGRGGRPRLQIPALETKDQGRAPAPPCRDALKAQAASSPRPGAVRRVRARGAWGAEEQNKSVCSAGAVRPLGPGSLGLKSSCPQTSFSAGLCTALPTGAATGPGGLLSPSALGDPGILGFPRPCRVLKGQFKHERALECCSPAWTRTLASPTRSPPFRPRTSDGPCLCSQEDRKLHFEGTRETQKHEVKARAPCRPSGTRWWPRALRRDIRSGGRGPGRGRRGPRARRCRPSLAAVQKWWGTLVCLPPGALHRSGGVWSKSLNYGVGHKCHPPDRTGSLSRCQSFYYNITSRRLGSRRITLKHTR